MCNDCCKLCGEKFEDGVHKNDKFLRHNYKKHFTKQLDMAWNKSSVEGICPINNCGNKTRTRDKTAFTYHYFSAKHGILDKLITDELQQKHTAEKENVRQSNEKICETTRPIENNKNSNDDTPNENNEISNSAKKNDSKSSFKSESVDKNDKTNEVDEEKQSEKMFNCDSCGEHFMHIRTLISHKKQVHSDIKNEEKIEPKTAGFLQNIEKSNQEVDFDTTKTSIGKKHALKKYEQFALNTSCF